MDLPMPKGPQGQKPQSRWLAALIVFGPALFVAGAAAWDWAVKPPRAWIGAELIIVVALLIGQWFYRKRIVEARGT
jgi:hypothetical protein